MKTSSIVVIFFTFLFMNSCSRDNVEDNFFESNDSLENDLQKRNPPADDCIITVGMVYNSVPGSYTMAPYTVYASCGGNTKNYERQVEIYITKDNDIIDTAYVTIPANKNVSNNAAVDGCGGRVTVKIANVINLTNFGFDNSCSWRQTQGRFPECATSGSPGSPIDYCNGHDADNDGICDDNDPDYGSETGFD
jgi:hypothetical protein